MRPDPEFFKERETVDVLPKFYFDFLCDKTMLNETLTVAEHFPNFKTCLKGNLFHVLSLCNSQCFVPSKVEGLVQKDGELIGRLHYKEGHDLYHWRVGWFLLEGSALHFSSGEEEGEEEVLQLKQLQELSKNAVFFCFSLSPCKPDNTRAQLSYIPLSELIQ